MIEEQPALTPWYPPSIKPVREGVYAASANIVPNEDCYRYWDGSVWRGVEFGSTSVNPEGMPSDYQDKIHWRGLAEQPKGARRA